MSKQFDVLVIGAGPGGYIAAIRAGQLGLNVACCEGNPYDDPKGEARLGGTCLNVGCIPSKALLASSEEFENVQHHLGDHGITVGDVKVDVAKMLKRKDDIVGKMTKGIEFRFNAPFKKVEKREDGSLLVHVGGGSAPIETDLLLFATGRVPYTKGLGLEAAGVELDKDGAIKVGDDNRSNVPSIYAVGDVTNRVQLTPVAIREGQAFADTVFGNKPHTVDYGCIPSAVFSHPPIAGVGMTEAEARNKLGTVKVYTSDFRPMKNVLANRNERSLYKMIVDAETERVVGIHMIGPDAPEILQAAAVAVKAGLTKQAFDDTVALHPSMAEELVLLK